MEKLCLAYRRQIARAGLACVLSLSALLISPPAAAQESAAQKELSRRLENARKAHGLLKSGDQAYRKKDYKSAVRDYGQAFELLPTGALNSELRSAAAERYATAATERSRYLAKNGSYDEARKLLETVLNPSVAPAHFGALKLKQQIEDPIKYNPALTPEHVTNIVKVARLLREAEGFYSLGQYDRALTVYQAALRIDPFNKAARRGMERVNVIQSDYYRAAKDQTRSELLANVDKNWELFTQPADSSLSYSPADAPTSLTPDLRDKLVGITVDIIDLDNVGINEALDFVRIQSRQGDIPDASGEQQGINIIANFGDPTSDVARKISSARITLKARNLPLSKVIDYITDQTHTEWRTDGVGVLVTPLGTVHGSLLTRSFRVPPNFLTAATTKKQVGSGNPFDDVEEDEGKLPARMNITDFLKQSGVTFPDGASATYTPSNNTLIVRNTPGNIDLVDQLVNLATSEEPVMVVIKTSIIRVSEEKLKELGFDWAITPMGISSEFTLGGGSIGNGTNIGTLAAPLSAGLRSGRLTETGDAIDTFLNASQTGIPSDNTVRAPGILTLSAVTNYGTIQMLMRGLNNNTGADVLVRPSSIQRSGERAKIEVIREFNYPTEYEPPELPSTFSGTTFIDLISGETATDSPAIAVSPSHPTAFESRNVGVTLEVEPTVGPNKKFIELSLRPEMVEFEGFVNYGSPINGTSASDILVDLSAIGTGNAFTILGGSFGVITDNRILMPIFKTIRLKNSTLTIQDGATVVLGTVINARNSKTEDKIPFLGDIPYAGRLFRSEAEHTFRQAVIVTVTAELVDPTGTPWRNR